MKRVSLNKWRSIYFEGLFVRQIISTGKTKTLRDRVRVRDEIGS